MSRHPLVRLTLALLFALASAAPFVAAAQTVPSIPARHIRVHYFRPDAAYAGWTVYAFFDTTEPNDFPSGPVQVTGSDDFGAYFDVGVTANAQNVGLILHKGDTKDPGPNQYVQPATQGNEFWELSGSDVLLTHRPPTGVDPAIPPGKARIHYHRADGNYDNWSLYVYGSTTDPTGNFCVTEDQFSGYDSYGPYFDVGVSNGYLGFIIHNCQTGVKDPGQDQSLQIPAQLEGWVVSDNQTVYPQLPTAAQILSGGFQQLQAYWIDADTVALQAAFAHNGYTYGLTYSPSAGLQIAANGLTGGTTIPLTPYSGTLTAEELQHYPQLASYALFKLPAETDAKVRTLALQSQLQATASAPDGPLQYTTGVQTFGALDATLAYNGRLGVIVARPWDREDREHCEEGPAGRAEVEIRVWAPSAQNVSLLLFDRETETAPRQTLTMQRKGGVWVAKGDRSWLGKYYQFSAQVFVAADQAVEWNTTTDPYSVDLSLNGTMSRIVDLSSDAMKPPLWDETMSPPSVSLSDTSIYELHIRDFSVGDSTVPAEHQGTYRAFTDFRSDGMRHLKELAAAGLKDVHLLPSFHFGSVDEDKSKWTNPGNLAGYGPDSQQQQADVQAVQKTDAYNWGYDPVHYMAPAGQYAQDPSQRVREYREMVQGLHASGLRVIQDVVFNHTYTSGQTPSANLDELVPNYYHRLDANGVLETGSCCADTASEHRMMEKLMIDTVLLNARQYKIDGFRFDAMGLHFVYNMVDLRNALNALTPEKDGVDGRRIYIYGEGFQIAEAANNAIGPNASQLNLYGTGIGSFNDRIRDSVRGGYIFGTDLQAQGYATGLFHDPNSETSQSIGMADQRTGLLQDEDLIRSSLAGALRDFTFTNAQGQVVKASQLTFMGQAAGYAASPLENVNYVSVHDNQTLFDAIQVKSSQTETIEQRARRQVLAFSLVALGQGVPFFHAADDLLRSKDMDNGSYNSGDWFNKIDWSGRGNNWGIGLPLANVNQAQWSFEQPLLANPSLKPSPASIGLVAESYKHLLAVRYSTRLFRMSTLAEVQAHLTFLNTGPSQTPGLIVMKLDDPQHTYGPYAHVVVFFNADTQPVTYTDAALSGLPLFLHPALRQSTDAVLRNSAFDPKTGVATIPALSTVVFVSDRE